MTGHAETAFDFDSPVDRRNTASLKWDRYRGRDVLPLWVADMDFKAPPAVIAALHSHADHGVFGYTLPPDDLMEAVLDMLYRDQSWRVEPEWIVWLPGLVTGLNVACRAAGRPGDEVMTATPVYPPFLSAPVLSQRTLLTVAHGESPGGYVFDFDRLTNAITERTRLKWEPFQPRATGAVIAGGIISGSGRAILLNLPWIKSTVLFRLTWVFLRTITVQHCIPFSH